MKINWIPLLIGIVMISCDRTEKRIQYSLHTIFDEDALSEAEYLFILPRLGCSGCINNATSFVVENLDEIPNSLVLITGVEDNKKLRIQVGEEFLSHEDVVIDKGNEFMKPPLASSYPRIIRLKNGKVMEVSAFDSIIANSIVID
jgi:hypothetical protein